MGPDGGNEVAAVQVVVLRCVYFFFSSRRRHTRCSRDWSSTCALPILGGLCPSSCLYMRTAWVDSHKAQVQGLVNALVGALRYIHAHSAEEIASRVPAHCLAGDRSTYVRALAESRVIFTPDGRMPASG